MTPAYLDDLNTNLGLVKDSRSCSENNHLGGRHLICNSPLLSWARLLLIQLK